MWQRLGRMGTISEFWRIFGEVNPEHIREEAERPFRLLLLGAPGSGKTTLAEALAGGRDERARAADVLLDVDHGEVAIRPNGDGDGATSMPAVALPAPIAPFEVATLPRADFSVCVIDGTRRVNGADRRAIEALRRAGRRCAVFLNKCDVIENMPKLRYDTYAALGDMPPDRIAFGAANRAEDVETVVAQLLLEGLPGSRLALARRLPALRRAVGDEIIVETARVNAEFALLSNLPANIPIVGGLLGGGADFLVLTKNQGMMIFKLAAIHGRDLRSKPTLAAEVAPVVGAAFLWRTIARELIGMLPSFVAAVPKTAIGYVGTYVVGKMAQYYYAKGSRPTREMMRRFSGEAAHGWRRLVEARAQLPQLALWPTKRGIKA